jgi:hypothetical protein
MTIVVNTEISTVLLSPHRRKWWEEAKFKRKVVLSRFYSLWLIAIPSLCKRKIFDILIITTILCHIDNIDRKKYLVICDFILRRYSRKIVSLQLCRDRWLMEYALHLPFISRFIYSMYGRCAAVFNVNGGHTIEFSSSYRPLLDFTKLSLNLIPQIFNRVRTKYRPLCCFIAESILWFLQKEHRRCHAVRCSTDDVQKMAEHKVSNVVYVASYCNTLLSQTRFCRINCVCNMGSTRL